jgi:hypothetical protein
MPSLSTALKPTNVNLEELLLDPNNPRFAELGQKMDAVPENRFAEAKVQQQTYERMKTPRFDVSELRDTIKNLGFLPMDRIVVRRWKGGDGQATRFVVVEGNRRVAALKWLIELQESGRESFTSEQLKNFTLFEVLLLNDDSASDNSKLILPGLRHVSGIKEWGPYQKARAVHALREAGLSSQEAAQSIGLSTRGANQLWRSYLALEQMREDEEYGEFAEPGLYSYFEEVFKRGNVRDWLAWSDDHRKFTNTERLNEFYGWMVGEPNDAGEVGEKKLPEAKSVRILGEIIEDQGAMMVLRSSGGSLTRAKARFEAEHPQEWVPTVSSAENILASLSPDTLRKLEGEELAVLEKLRVRVDQVLEDRKRLRTD